MVWKRWETRKKIKGTAGKEEEKSKQDKTTKENKIPEGTDQIWEILDALNQNLHRNDRKMWNSKIFLKNMEILIPKLKFRFWRNLDIFNNYNNFKGGKNLLENFKENYKFLKVNRIYQAINKYKQ